MSTGKGHRCLTAFRERYKAGNALTLGQGARSIGRLVSERVEMEQLRRKVWKHRSL